MEKSLEAIAKALVVSGKGILAADESTGTIGKRFATINVENTVENRQAYRELLFTAAGINQYISGVILYDETIRQKTKDGKFFTKVLEDQGIISGIKVDLGTVDLPFCPGDKITEGLDGLGKRLQEYYTLGARFAKWRAIYTINIGATPSENCLRTNAQALARYAALCQVNGIVPIVEPEVLMNGGHDIEACFEVTQDVLEHVFEELKQQGVNLKGILLKPNMIVPGEEAPLALPTQVAERTIDCLKSVVPEEVPGLVFISGGQSEPVACANLNAIAKLGGPWPLSFSYGRALQASALAAWQGNVANVAAAQQAFLQRAKLVSLARDGKYSPELE